MKKLFTILLLITSLSGFSQTNQAKIDSVKNIFQKYFNEQNPEKLYELTGEDFRKQISEIQIKQVSKQLYTQLGTWKNSEFQKI